jgi:predicted  nucleic acid-binding Zn-ribbon protein
MDPATIVTITTSIISVIAALAAAYSTVRKGQLDALNATIVALEKRVSDLEADLASERDAHKATATDLAAERAAHQATRAELTEAHEQLRNYRRTYGLLKSLKGAH